MRSTIALLFLLCSAAQSADLATPVAKIELNKDDGLVFLGDSITHQCLYTQYVEDFFYTRYPDRRIRFHNAGVGGDRCSDALARFEKDVAPHKPKYVTVLLGMNDGGYQPFNQQIFDTYERDMLQVIERIRAIGAIPIVMTPTMYDSRASIMQKRGNDGVHKYYNGVLAYFGSRLREMAFAQGLGFVDMYSPLNSITLEQRKAKADFTIIADAVHPGPDGQVVMAAAILNDMHPNHQVSTVHVVVDKSGYAKVNAIGAKTTMVESDSATLAFGIKADSLPWVLPGDAQQGYALTKAGHRLSREALRVSGLKTGSYELKIEGQAVGTFTEQQLSRGIELQGNNKTPQYQQSLQVATLNRERNEQAMKPLRDLWGALKRFQSVKRAAEAKTADEKAKNQIKQLESQLAGFDEKVAGLIAKAKGIEDKIYQANQPKELRYELVPVAKRTGG